MLLLYVQPVSAVNGAYMQTFNGVCWFGWFLVLVWCLVVWVLFVVRRRINEITVWIVVTVLLAEDKETRPGLSSSCGRFKKSRASPNSPSPRKQKSTPHAQRVLEKCERPPLRAHEKCGPCCKNKKSKKQSSEDLGDYIPRRG